MTLDNCEDALAAVPRIAEEILRRCPGVKVVATSRGPLNARGESIYRVGALACPDDAEYLTLPLALKYPAVAMFADRAAIALSETDAPSLAGRDAPGRHSACN